MVKSKDENGGSSSSIAPFLNKCYDMVEDERTDGVISWGNSDNTFVIWDITQFTVQLLPKYFKHSNFSSFMRQLNIYGFKKVDPDRWEFANEGFVKGQKHLLKTIHRRKHVQAAEQKQSSKPLNKYVQPKENTESYNLWKEVETLKKDKKSLMQELVKLRQHQETSENKLLVLRDRIQGMEKNQQQLLSFLVMAMQSPAILVQLLKPKESNWRKAETSSMLHQLAADTGSLIGDGTIVKYQPPDDELPNLAEIPIPSGSGENVESGQSVEGNKDIFMNIDFLKILMDGNFRRDNHLIGLPEFPDAWEQFLLGGPSKDKTDEINIDKEDPDDSTMLTGSALPRSIDANCNSFEILMKQMEEYHEVENETVATDSHGDNGMGLEFLTEQMEHLSSDSNIRQHSEG